MDSHNRPLPGGGRLTGHTHHQRSASAGSHNLFNLHHFSLPPQSQAVMSAGSPDLVSDEDDNEWDTNGTQPPDDLQGTLSKWTNYIHGWQDRYIALKEGTLVYFKSEVETDFGCRGAISIDKATVKQHDVDDLRFDVSVSDCVWYLRATSVEDRQRWIDGIESHKRFSQEGGGGAAAVAATGSNFPLDSTPLSHLRRHDSALSLASTASKSGGGSSLRQQRSLAEKLAEIETFRDILCRQIDTLQSYFEACSDVASMDPTQNDAAAAASAVAQSQLPHSSQHHTSSITKDMVRQHGIHAVDFKGEAITFKATTAGIVATMSHCIDLMNQREDQWRRKLEREQIAKKRLEEKCAHLTNARGDEPRPQPSSVGKPAQPTQSNQCRSESVPVMAKPVGVAAASKVVSSGALSSVVSREYEESVALSQIGEDEFFDAVEDALDKLQEEQDYRDKMKLMSLSSSQKVEMMHHQSEASQHQLWPTIDKVSNEQLHYARMQVGDVWELFAEDGEMRMYKREEEKDGLVVDPLKALHSVRGVTARELCNYFFAPEFRMEWETTVEQVSVLEKLAPDTMVFLQLHKRVWPAAQRDALFWSHMRHVQPEKEWQNGPDGNDTRAPDDVWMVCNQSTKHPDGPENQGGCLRVGLTVCFVCDTFVDAPFTKETAGRKDLQTKITYCSVVNPGGWAPATVLRQVFKREYPRFLKRFTQYVIDKSKDKPIMW